MLIKGDKNSCNSFIMLQICGQTLFKTDEFNVKKLFIKNKKNTCEIKLMSRY